MLDRQQPGKQVVLCQGHRQDESCASKQKIIKARIWTWQCLCISSNSEYSMVLWILRIYHDRWSVEDLKLYSSTFNSKIKCWHNSEIKEVFAGRTSETLKIELKSGLGWKGISIQSELNGILALKDHRSVPLSALPLFI